MGLPDFLVIGAPKAGTTALHSALARHPALHLSPVKEPKFFLTDGPPPTRGGPGDVQTYREHVWRREDYEALFDAAPEGALKGESTPFYLHDLDAQRRIRALIPDVRLIVVLRDPVERAHSNWTHLWSAGLEPVDDIVEACRLEEERKADGWSAFWHYLDLGRYGEQLEHLYTLFSREQVLVFRYWDLLYEPAATLDRVFAFLGVEQGLVPDVPKANVTAHPEPTWRRAVLARALRVATAVDSVLPGHPLRATVTVPLERALQRGGPARRPLTWAERSALLPFFEADVKLLEKVTGEDFADWLRPRDASGGRVGERPAGQYQARNGRPR
ncbi:hypothetical protein GCM10027589_10570 [Actinocorallia lasiicapitis]